MDAFSAFPYPLAPEVLQAFRKSFMEPHIPLVQLARMATLYGNPHPEGPQGLDRDIQVPVREAVEEFPELNDRLVDFTIVLQDIIDRGRLMHYVPFLGELRQYWGSHCKYFSLAIPIPFSTGSLDC